ncbi:MAG: hypothetical protein J6J44_12960 [Lachnospiraceae bacterium]|nr:hypothetical protein [Lachnospiraceae bacterium]
MEYTLKQAVSVAIKCGREYKRKLANTKLLVIYRNRENSEIESIEIVFRPSNFQHLTGLQLLDKQGKQKQNCAVEFYHKCTGNNLNIAEVRFKDDGTTPLKLDALPSLMDLTNITKIIGDYDESKKWMEADVIVGGINFCLAVSEDKDGSYFPRSGLLEDIRNITRKSSQVLAIFQKKLSDKEVYKKICYVAKGLNLSNLNLPSDISEQVNVPEKK